jgi:hypothetical protein
MPASARMASNKPGNLLSLSRIRNRARQRASCRSMMRLRAAWVTHAAVGCGVTPRIWIRRCVCSITARTYMRVPARVTVSKKSQASRASAWERRNWVQVLDVRSGAGWVSASVRISQTVEAATFRPKTGNSPWMRR